MSPVPLHFGAYMGSFLCEKRLLSPASFLVGLSNARAGITSIGSIALTLETEGSIGLLLCIRSASVPLYHFRHPVCLSPQVFTFQKPWLLIHLISPGPNTKGNVKKNPVSFKRLLHEC